MDKKKGYKSLLSEIPDDNPHKQRLYYLFGEIEREFSQIFHENLSCKNLKNR